MGRYHEYEYAGRITRRSGSRLGNYYEFQETLDPDNFPPMSKFWQLAADQDKKDMIVLIGDDAYPVFAEYAWPGAEIEELTWREIHNGMKAAIALAERGERDPHVLGNAALFASSKEEE